MATVVCADGASERLKNAIGILRDCSEELLAIHIPQAKVEDHAVVALRQHGLYGLIRT